MTALEIFKYAGQQVRTVGTADAPRFVAMDVLSILDLDRTALRRLDADEKGVDSIHTLGGTQELSTVTESGLYSLVLGSRKEGAREFKRWITREVIPAIRKTGSYSVQMPQDYASALRELAASVERQAALEVKVKDDAPKVLFADSVATSRSTILVGELAKVLRGNGVNIGQNRLFERLREEGFLIRRQGSDWNMPTQRAMERALFEIKETAVTHSDGHVTVNKTPKVTGKGQVYFINRYTQEIPV